MSEYLNEERWRTDSRPAVVINCCEFNGQRLLTNRKCRLYGCACYRLIWERIGLPSIRRFVELAEARADQWITQSELDKERESLGGHPSAGSLDHILQSYSSSLLVRMVKPAYIAWTVASALRGEPLGWGDYHESQEQANLARDIFGNPFRPVSFEPDWRTSTAVALAQHMYDARDFSAMPILADALQDAGCDNDDVLTHCRAADGVHVRGCWVVDLVLGKS